MPREAITTVTPGMLEADCPANEHIGRLFSEFCKLHGAPLLDGTVVQKDDDPGYIGLIFRNRMRRAYEAGYDACRYKLEPEETK